MAFYGKHQDVDKSVTNPCDKGCVTNPCIACSCWKHKCIGNYLGKILPSIIILNTETGNDNDFLTG